MQRFRTLSYANVVATLALVLAVTGGAYAATQLPKDSIRSKQVKDHSLKARDFKPGQLPTGAPGPKGDRGDAGARGEPGQAGPSVLLSGHHTANGETQQTSCPIYSMDAPLTITRPTILYANGLVHFQALAPATSYTHFSTLRVLLRDAQDTIVGETLTGREYGPNDVDARASGLIVGTDGAPVEVQPATYTLELRLSVGSVFCSGSSMTSSPALEWLGFPVAT
jgi:hypothetical protein